MSFCGRTVIIGLSQAMKHELPVRITVNQPLPGVVLRVQRGKDELLDSTRSTPERTIFEFELTVDTSQKSPNFLGKYSQGPKDARFIYVNSGRYAGMHIDIWSRRAKLPLTSVTKIQIDEVVNGNGILACEYDGVGPDGGPACATIKGLVWKVVKR